MLGLRRTLLSFRTVEASVLQSFPCRQSACSFSSADGDQNPNLFFDDGVQSLLKKLTRKDMNKVFRKRKEGKGVKDTVYKFMTTAQLEEAVRDAERKADELLQMPPVMSERKEIDHVLVKDEKLVGLFKSKFIFTDISLGKTDRNRAIAVRDEQGTLRLANWEERTRMNQIYFPRPARELWVPVMFQDENLSKLLEKNEWEFILDRACAQFEPDDPEYIRVTRKVYEFVNSSGNFNNLRSTRHYGPLVFHLAQSNNLDTLLAENLETDRLEDACWAIQLYKILHPDANVDSSIKQGSELDYVKAFIDNCSNEKAKLELAYKNFKHYMSNPRSAAAV
uniref:28S ribosomal protein S22, mitochondrial n=1 Tax=Lygus hesperus TaxID=30085 RepID=A0A0A9W4H6_LYGHE